MVNVFRSMLLVLALGQNGCGAEESGDPRERQAASSSGLAVKDDVPVATPLHANGQIRIQSGITIGVAQVVDERIAERLAILPNDYSALSNVVIEAIGKRRRAVGRDAFMIVSGPVENNGANVIVKAGLEANSSGEPYRLTLSATQGTRIWSRTVERGRGNERPGFERLIAGEEGPLMTLNQRLAASLWADNRDLSSELVQHIDWEIVHR